jgi:hypothetical protein
MPGTYILLRNNKQTGPHSLEALLQHSLQPHDLIWVEGQSAGWRYPSEINALKPFVTGENPAATTAHPNSQTAEEKPASKLKPEPDQTTRLKNAKHIYVSLPAGMPLRTEANPETQAAEPEPADALEAKAAALRQRVQAFAEGRVMAHNSETHYARSLDDMKQEYGTWLVKQKTRKKHSTTKRILFIAASLLVVTASGFGIVKWMRGKPLLPKPDTNYAANPVDHPEAKQTTTVAFHAVADTFTTTSSGAAPVLQDTVAKQAAPATGKTAATTVKKQSTEKQKLVVPEAPDTIQTMAAAAVPQMKPPGPEAVKKVIPLSRLLVVNGTFQYDKKGTNITAMDVALQNNSSETLKLVTVTVTYLRKEDRPFKKETLSFYNVQPATTPVITIAGNRRATSARVEIGSITRADGSLYFIH